MIQLIAANGEISYGVNEYVIDTDIELADIPKSAEAGSTAYSVSSGSTFIKGNDGNWSVKNTGANGGGGQGGSTVVELPDNLLYSYEMTEEEFWENYSNGSLNDGLYEYVSGEAQLIIKATENTNNINLESLSEPVIYGDSFWAVSYELENTILEFDKYGNIKQMINILDLPFNNNNIQTPSSFQIDQSLTSYGADGEGLIIDDNGFLYLSNSVGYCLTLDTNNILNCQLTYGDQNKLIFRQSYQSYDTSFNISDGGCFGFYVGGFFGYGERDWKHQVIYFKNGLEQYNFANNEEFMSENTIIENSSWATVNYDTNQLFQIRHDNENLYLYTFNIDGTYKRIVLEGLSYFTTNITNLTMISKNKSLYLQFLIDNFLYIYLIDVENNLVLQQEQIVDFEHFNQTYYKNFYINNNYIIIANQGYKIYFDEYGHQHNLHTILLLKYYYQNEIPYIEPFYLSNAKYENSTTDFENWCQNNKLIYESYETYTACLLDFEDWSSINLNQSIVLYAQKIQYIQENNSILLFSYSGDADTDANILQIDTITGNIISKNYNLLTYFENIPPLSGIGSKKINSTIEYKSNLDIIICWNVAFDRKTLNPLYYIESNINWNESIEPIQMEDIILYKSNRNQFSYYDMSDGALKTSVLVHNNNILLSKQIT